MREKADRNLAEVLGGGVLTGLDPAKAERDLARYRFLLRWALDGLRGRFTLEELEVLAQTLEKVASSPRPEFLPLVPERVREDVEHGGVHGLVVLKDPRGFLAKVAGLDRAEIFALVDAVERYLVLPREERGERGWRKLGLL